jgi:hypothetical protein
MCFGYFESIDEGFYIKTDSGRTGYFLPKNLEKLVEVSETKFKAGDRVQINNGPDSMWNGPGTVEYFGNGIYVVKSDTVKLSGGFYPDKLTLIESKPILTYDTTLQVSAYETALQAAINIATKAGVVTADDVQAAISTHGYSPKQLGNAAGAIFRNSRFRKVGEVRSTRQSNRGRKIAQWELVTN